MGNWISQVKADAPSKQRDRQNQQADRPTIRCPQVIGPDVGNARQHEGQHAGNHEQAEIQFAFGVQASGVVKVEPVRAEQNQNGDDEDLVVAVPRS
jgi:hypothetical protein